MAETPESLALKIFQYEEKLNQVRALRASDPSNPQYIKLCGDLEQAIALTNRMLQVANPAAAAATAAAPAPAPKVATQEAPQEAPAAPAAPAAEPAQTEGEYDPTAAAGESTEAFSIGSKVEVLSDKKWYPAVITSVSEGGLTFGVHYLGYDTEAQATLQTMRQLVKAHDGVSVADAEVGHKCSAIYAGDGQLYDCVIQEITEHGYKVMFPAYGNVEEVPLEYLRRQGATLAAPEPKEEAKRELTVPKAALAEDGSFKIPDNLRLLPTDTNAERETKRRKVKALKSRYKKMSKEEDTNTKKSSWQTFATGKGTKRVKGSMKGMRKESIFKTPDSITSKVGVVGSGAGMTDFEQRKRFKKK
ncbi:unnamed protein product [Chrysoparadoxa australica]